MRFILIVCIVISTLISCKEKEITTKEPQPKITEEQKVNPIEGTWELISGTTKQGDSTINKDLTNKKMIKIINDSHFAFFNHDLDKGKDSLSAYYVSGGGTYRFNHGIYVESLEYCTARKWEGYTFEFTVEIKGDTLIQKGLEEVKELGVQREITEIYLKSKE